MEGDLEPQDGAADVGPVAVPGRELDGGLVLREAGAAPGRGRRRSGCHGGDEGREQVDGVVERVHHGPRHLPRQDGQHVPRAEGHLQPELHRPGAPRQRGGRHEEHEEEGEGGGGAPPRRRLRPRHRRRGGSAASRARSRRDGTLARWWGAEGGRCRAWTESRGSGWVRLFESGSHSAGWWWGPLGYGESETGRAHAIEVLFLESCCSQQFARSIPDLVRTSEYARIAKSDRTRKEDTWFFLFLKN